MLLRNRILVKNRCVKCLFLYNPNSGKGKLGKELPRIRKILFQRYDEVETVVTVSAEDLATRVKNADCDVIISGGDGTFHTALQGAEGKRLGYLPSGTVNDVARSLGLTKRIGGSLGVILKGGTAEIDCMRAGEEKVAYVAAAGAFTESTYCTPQSQKKALGPLAYALHGLKHGLPLDVFPVKITCDGNVTETDAVLVLILNGRSVAGFPVNRKGSMRDGMLEAAVVRQVKRPNLRRRMRALLSIGAVMLFGIRVRRKDILFLRGHTFLIETKKDLVWDLDGERGPRGNLGIELLPKHFRLFVPHSKNYTKII